MIKPATRALTVLLVLLAAAVQSPRTLAQDDGEPLVLEDVVRMFVAGTPTEELIELISRSQVEFDLSEEMLEELGLAGLPDALIQAMIDRQRELHPPAQPAEQPAEDQGREPGLRLALAVEAPGGQEDGSAIRVVNVVNPEILSRLRVKDDQAKITDVAVYVACQTATHVPDHWRSQTPLGRDFITVTRHRMLQFLPGATEEQDRAVIRLNLQSMFGGAPIPDGAAVLRLGLPPEVPLELDPSVPHELTVGIAVQIGGRYYRVTGDTLQNFLPDQSARRLEAQIRPSKNLDPWAIEVSLAR